MLGFKYYTLGKRWQWVGTARDVGSTLSGLLLGLDPEMFRIMALKLAWVVGLTCLKPEAVPVSPKTIFGIRWIELVWETKLIDTIFVSGILLSLWHKCICQRTLIMAISQHWALPAFLSTRRILLYRATATGSMRCLGLVVLPSSSRSQQAFPVWNVWGRTFSC